MYIDLVYRFVSVEKDKNKQSTLSKENHSSVRNTIENDLRIQSKVIIMRNTNTSL